MSELESKHFVDMTQEERQDIWHSRCLERNPERHNFDKSEYTREEASEKCFRCYKEYKASSGFEFVTDFKNDKHIKVKINEPTNI